MIAYADPVRHLAPATSAITNAGWQIACKREPFSRQNGSDSLSLHLGLCCADEASLEKIDLSPPVHLAFDELELGYLTFGLDLPGKSGGTFC